MKFLQIPSLLLASTLMAAPCVGQEVKVAVFSINDFHGAFVRNDFKGIPGAPAVLQTLDSLKQVYPYNVTVSAGDAFGGSYFYKATQGQLMPVFFNEAGIRISALGNHEFDDGVRALTKKWSNLPQKPKDWDLTYVCANMRSTSSGQIPDFAQPVASVPVKLPGGKTFRVAFAGLITSSTPQQTSKRNVNGLTFDGNYPAVLDSVMKLPEHTLIDDAHLRLLLTHIGSRTNEDGQPVWDDKDRENLSRLNATIWDGFISAHSHQPVCGRINAAQYPIVQAQSHGNYISMLLCTVDTKRMVVTDVEPNLIRVTPKKVLEPRAARMQAQIDSLLQNTRTKGGTPLGEVLTTAKNDLPHNRNKKWRQTEMGTLVCKAFAETYRQHAKLPDDAVIIGMSHIGSIRAGLTKGPVSVLEVGEALPFANRMKVYELTGKQLFELVDFGLHNKVYGWLQLGNAIATCNKAGNLEAVIYCNGKGKRQVLQPKGKYIIVTDEFITSGGDGYNPSLFPANQEIKVEGLPYTTDAFINYLRQQPEI